jgi:hypothetical protein
LNTYESEKIVIHTNAENQALANVLKPTQRNKKLDAFLLRNQDGPQATQTESADYIDRRRNRKRRFRLWNCAKNNGVAQRLIKSHLINVASQPGAADPAPS